MYLWSIWRDQWFHLRANKLTNQFIQQFWGEPVCICLETRDRSWQIKTILIKPGTCISDAQRLKNRIAPPWPSFNWHFLSNLKERDQHLSNTQIMIVIIAFLYRLDSCPPDRFHAFFRIFSVIVSFDVVWLAVIWNMSFLSNDRSVSKIFLIVSKATWRNESVACSALRSLSEY